MVTPDLEYALLVYNLLENSLNMTVVIGIWASIWNIPFICKCFFCIYFSQPDCSVKGILSQHTTEVSTCGSVWWIPEKQLPCQVCLAPATIKMSSHSRPGKNVKKYSISQQELFSPFQCMCSCFDMDTPSAIWIKITFGIRDYCDDIFWICITSVYFSFVLRLFLRLCCFLSIVYSSVFKCILNTFVFFFLLLCCVL